jgi:hypothetical protein
MAFPSRSLVFVQGRLVDKMRRDSHAFIMQTALRERCKNTQQRVSRTAPRLSAARIVGRHPLGGYAGFSTGSTPRDCEI